MIGLVIVGAGHTGLRAALAARGAGFAGEITLTDPDPTFPLRTPTPVEMDRWCDVGCSNCAI